MRDHGFQRDERLFHLHVCWGAAGGRVLPLRIRKELLPAKMFASFEHRVIRPSNPLVRGFDEVFYAPTAATPP